MSENWEMLNVKTKYLPNIENRDLLFSMVKNILSRIEYERMFYLHRKYFDEEKKETYIQIDFILCDVKLRKKINEYLEQLGFSYSWQKYERNHVIEALEKTSKFCTSFDFRPDVGALGYIIHCICENFFYTKSHEIDIYANLIRTHNKKISDDFSL